MNIFTASEEYMPRVLILFLPILLALLLFSCGSDSSPRNDDIFIEGTFRVSDCGGFEKAQEKTARSVQDTSETLRWTYGSKTRILEIVHADVLLNCCGEHSIVAEWDGDVIVIAESDQPADEGRCHCLCRFDFSSIIPGLSPEVIGIRLELTVDSTVIRRWSGDIDLSEGSGELQLVETD